MSLFKGTPQTATSYVTSSTETPKWLQDAIFNQIYQSTNVANTPFTPYSKPLIAGITPQQQRAYDAVSAQQGAFRPALTAAQTGTQSLANAGGGAAAAAPYMSQAAGMNPLTAAAPYLTQAGVSSYSNVGNYMNPYTTNVTDQIARLGARNLSENLLPAVSDSFIRAGQFGGTRMGEFGSRALRDTGDSVLNQQAQALQSGYGQALSAAQQDASRQAQIGSTTGQLQGQQQQLLASLGTQTGQLTQADQARQQSVLQQMASMAQQGQQLGISDAAALEAAGVSQQGASQRQLDSAYQQYLLEQQYPKSQLDWLSTQVRGMAPNVASQTSQSSQGTGQTYSASPLSQIAAGFSGAAGLNTLLNR